MLIYLQLIDDPEDRTKFEQLYHRYRGLMFYVANQLLHSAPDAEDAVHQAFLSILPHLKKFSEIDCPKTRAFVFIIVERKALDLLRSRSRHPTQDLDEEQAGVEIPYAGDDPLAAAMAKLPAQYRQALLLRYYVGYSTREIGALLGKKPAAAQKLLTRAKARLREILEQEGFHDF